MTEEASAILGQLEVHASHMTYLTALMNAFIETDPFAREATHEQRYASLCCCTAISDLAAHYAASAKNVIDTYYARNRL